MKILQKSLFHILFSKRSFRKIYPNSIDMASKHRSCTLHVHGSHQALQKYFYDQTLVSFSCFHREYNNVHKTKTRHIKYILNYNITYMINQLYHTQMPNLHTLLDLICFKEESSWRSSCSSSLISKCSNSSPRRFLKSNTTNMLFIYTFILDLTSLDFSSRNHFFPLSHIHFAIIDNYKNIISFCFSFPF